MKLIGSRSTAGSTGAAAQADLAGVRAVHAGQDLDQGRLAGTVLAQQRVHLAGPDVEIDIVERQRAGEPLEAADLEERRRRDASRCGDAGYRSTSQAPLGVRRGAQTRTLSSRRPTARE